MKIDKNNYEHWLIVLLSSTYLVLAILLRRLNIIKPNRSRVVFYGHTFNGNLKAVAEYIVDNDKNIEVFYATINPQYYESMMSASTDRVGVLSMLKFRDVVKAVGSNVVVSDRGAQTLELINILLSSVNFVDVWHGIPYKGFTPEDFKHLKRYSEVWVSSPAMKKMYEEKFGVSPEKVKATGYARVDKLAASSDGVSDIKAKYGIPSKYKKVVLLAPTWKQDSKGRSIIPFGVSEEDFFKDINKIGRDNNTLFIFRAHINVDGAKKFKNFSNIKNMPYAQYPDAEEFLAISDVLVTDWSSIAFDFLVTGRPTVFLDVEPPFKNGFSLGPEYRFGEVVGSQDALCAGLVDFIKTPTNYNRKYKQEISMAMLTAYGSTADGMASKRAYSRLKNLM